MWTKGSSSIIPVVAILLFGGAVVYGQPVGSGRLRPAPLGPSSQPLGIQVSPASTERSSVRGTLDRYCTTCHNARLKTGGLDLETASRFLIYGFASEVIDTVRDDYLRSYLEELFLSSLPSYSFEF